MADSEPAKPRDIAVFWSRRDSHCDGCDADLGRGSAIRLDGDKAFCLACADMEHLWFLPSGDTALTRRARKHSRLSAVVLAVGSLRFIDLLVRVKVISRDHLSTTVATRAISKEIGAHACPSSTYARHW